MTSCQCVQFVLRTCVVVAMHIVIERPFVTRITANVYQQGMQGWFIATACTYAETDYGLDLDVANTC